jgi:anti-anti-sigma factor
MTTSATHEEPEQLTVVADEPRPGVLVLRLTGWLDLATAPELEARLHELLDARSPRSLLLDLGHTEVLGSAGVAVLLRLRRRALVSGWGPPRLVGLTGCARRTLHMLGLEDLFPPADDRQAA